MQIGALNNLGGDGAGNGSYFGTTVDVPATLQGDPSGFVASAMIVVTGELPDATPNVSHICGAWDDGATEGWRLHASTEALNGMRLGDALADSIEARTRAIYGIRQ